MAALQFVFFSVPLLSFSYGAPLMPNGGDELNLNAKTGVIEGDIMLTPEQYETFFGASKKNLTDRQKRQIFAEVGMWPDNTVSYSFDSSVPAAKRAIARAAMREVSARTCIKFREDNAIEARVQIEMGSVCSSYVGRTGGAQQMFIGGCSMMPNIIHELFHVLGMMHTHSRSDRDQFLKVNTSLFTGSDAVNYALYPTGTTYNLIPFEYGSLMLYRARDLCWPKDETFLSTMGIRVAGFYDFRAIHQLYKCSCPTEIECFHGGYMNTQSCDKCVCPIGYGGKQCETAPEKFSKKLTATADWQEYSVKFGFLHFYEVSFKQTTLFIAAPADKRIQVEVTRMDGFFCYDYCLISGFEVKELGDPRQTNRFVCCNSGQGWIYNYTSKVNPTPVTVYSSFGVVTFGMRYRFIDESISALPTTNNTYDDFRYPA